MNIGDIVYYNMKGYVGLGIVISESFYESVSVRHERIKVNWFYLYNIEAKPQKYNWIETNETKYVKYVY